MRVLAGMGNNLNQIAKALNTAAKVGTLGNVEALKATTNSLRDFLAKEKNGWQSQ
ncbi:TPA: plasmid mobilization relaxosome protein MobC [Neisseria gonorrhoeae]